MKSLLRLLCLALAFSQAHADDHPPAFIPFQKGAYWVYYGTVSRLGRTPDGKPIPLTQTVTWRSEVVAGPYPLGCATVWIVRGLPQDLVWSGTDVKPVDHVIFLIGTDYYVVSRHTDLKGPDTDFDKLEASVLMPTFDLDANKDEINRATLLCSFPLALGRRFDHAGTDIVNLIRTDRYGWVVEDTGSVNDTPKIKGFPPLRHPQYFDLAFRTSPDDSEMGIVPGLGLTNYHYHHHGTTMTVDLELVEFGPGN